MLWNDSEYSHPTSVALGFVTYEEEPDVVLIVYKGFTIVTFTKQSCLIWSIRFGSATKVTGLIINHLAGLQDRAPCQLAHVIEMTVWQL